MRGTAFDGDRFLQSAELASLFAETADEADFVSLLERLNGYFAVVQLMEQGCRFAVDRVRSIPLFYGLNGKVLIVGDDAERVKKQLPEMTPDPLSIKEFLLTGYVTGSDTLFSNIKQVQAGECLWTIMAAGRKHLTTHRYYRWIHGDYSDASHEELCHEMQRMHERVFERLLVSTEGRTLVVPLSGGYDSRLIAVMLKQMGRKDVICFSYGRPGNWEAEISRRVARKLGYRWHFIPCGYSNWRRWSRLGEWATYTRRSAGLCASPHLQDWPAALVLKSQELVPNDAVFVPGHTATLTIQSNMVDRLARETGSRSSDLFLQALRRCHYNIWKIDHSLFVHLFAKKNLIAINGLRKESLEDVAGCLDFWAWQERHAKFIINSVRVYEYFGFNWRIPLWDNEVMAFWRTVHLPDRVNKSLYRRLIRKKFRIMKVDYEQPVHAPPLNSKILHICTKLWNPYLGQYTINDYLKTRAFYNREFPLCVLQSVSKALSIPSLGTYVALDAICNTRRTSRC